MSRELPILFSGPMVRAILDGRKTQTRRLATSPLRRCEPRDRLWVREAHYLTDDGDHEFAVYAEDSAEVSTHLLRIDGLSREFPEDVRKRHKKLRPAMFMPRWASRLTLEVTEVRFQPLHDITEEDALAEGIVRLADGRHVTGLPDCAADWKSTGRQSYADLWVHLHGEGSWRSNPEIVAVTFKVHRANVDVAFSERET